MGMGIAFSNSANFSRIANASLAISEVKHKTFVEVNEEGTEAAAVTSVGIGLTAMPSTPSLRVDRPFIFAIREHQSGTILFIGKIVNPVAL
jgi:serpin B